MNRLIIHENEKIWRKKSFIISVISILILNLFLMWYDNRTYEMEPENSSYKELYLTLKEMDIEEQKVYFERLKDDIQGVDQVDSDISMNTWLEEQGGELTEVDTDSRYYKLYESGEYLKYTDNLSTERELIHNVYDEFEKVSGYDEYIEQMKNKKDSLNSISIFGGEKAEDDYTSRNIEKSATDYKNLTDIQVDFVYSKGLTSAMSGRITDILLVLIIMLFSVSLIFEEKDKKLFFITRSTALGRGQTIATKLLALLANSVVITGVMYTMNLLFFQYTYGVGNMFSSIQSVAPFMESTLRINILEYIILSVLTKALVLFGIGALLVFVAIVSKQFFVPYIFGVIYIVGSLALYEAVSPSAGTNYLRYLNVAGLLKTDNLYGSYYNFNFMEYPFSRLTASILMILILAIIGSVLCYFSFVKSYDFELKKINLRWKYKLGVHNSIFRHESYKILIMNKVIIIMVLFVIIIGGNNQSNVYYPTSGEEYYHEMMTELQGELTVDKEKTVVEENERYEQIKKSLEELENLAAEGKISDNQYKARKDFYSMQMVFYPSFIRVWEQYQHIKKNDGEFVYDTGYLYLFGKADNGSLILYIILVACMILCFGNVQSMENSKKSWYLLSATAMGKKAVNRNKNLICFLCATVVTIIAWNTKYMNINQYFPMNMHMAKMSDLLEMKGIGGNVPILCWIFFAMIMQIIAMIIVVKIVLVISQKMHTGIQSVFTCTMILVMPPILGNIGFETVKWISLYPIFTINETIDKILQLIV